MGLNFVDPIPGSTGVRRPYGARNSGGGTHQGVDWNALVGTPVLAVKEGTVVLSTLNGNDFVLTDGKKGTSYGNVVIIDHGENECGEFIYTVYAHLSSKSVSLGLVVTSGQVIGFSGGGPVVGAGNAYNTSPHLHFEVVVSDTPINWPIDGTSTGLRGKERMNPQDAIGPAGEGDSCSVPVPDFPVLPLQQTSFMRRDPLILDLDGDGIETVGLDAGVFFDHDDNGFSELTGWASSDDGILVWDRNGDGYINDGTELFGDNTPLPDGSMASNGFQALSAYDDNNDGKIDVNDAIWADLRIWRDAGYEGPDGDSETNGSELFTLNELGITSINLGSTITNTPDGNGNTQVRIGSFDKADGTTGAIGAYALQRDTSDTVYGLLPVPDAIAALPDAEGSGNVYSLHQAMVRDTTGALQVLVESFIAEVDSTNRSDILEQILFKWTSVDSVDPSSYGPGIDGRKVAFFEKFYGQTLGNPGANLAIQWNGLFRDISEIYYGQLMAQSHLRDLYSQISYSFDFDAFKRVGDLSAVNTLLQTELTNDPAAGRIRLNEFARTLRGLGIEDTVNYLSFRETFLQFDPTLDQVIDIAAYMPIITKPGQGLFRWSRHTLGDDNAQAIVRDPNFGDGFINGYGGNDVIYGSDRIETLIGEAGNSLFVAGGGNDRILAGDGDDILDGGAGNDLLYGEGGNDTYIFRRGSGQDTLYDGSRDPNNTDKVWLGSNLTADDLSYNRVGNDLVLSIIGADDTLTVKSFFANLPYVTVIQSMVFQDGTFLNFEEILNRAYSPSEGNDLLYGTAGNDAIDALGGNDTVYGLESDDVIQGGSGDDAIYNDDYTIHLKDNNTQVSGYRTPTPPNTAQNDTNDWPFSWVDFTQIEYTNTPFPTISPGSPA